MKKSQLFTVTALSVSLLSAPAMAADGLLTGTTKLACEAILCLSSPTRPSECTPSINKYFSIVASKPHKTIAKRRDFLKLCPTSNDATVSKTIEDIVNSKINDCTANGLNKAYGKKSFGKITGELFIDANSAVGQKALEQRCGKEWKNFVTYKCDEKQVIDYDATSQNGMVGAGLNGKIKYKTIQTNCRFEDK